MENINVELAIKMYRDDMLSVAQIGEQLGVSSKRIDYLLKKNGIEKRSISEAITRINITKFHKVPFIPKTDFTHNDIELKITGIMLYWGEGANTNSSVRLANSNPEIIKILIRVILYWIDEYRYKFLTMPE